MKSIVALVAITALITGISHVSSPSLAASVDLDAELGTEFLDDDLDDNEDDNEAVDMAVDEDLEMPPAEGIATPEQDQEDLDDEASEVDVDEEDLVEGDVNEEDVDPTMDGVDDESAGEGVSAEE